MNIIGIVQFVDQSDNRFLGCVRRQVIVSGIDTRILAGLALVADINLGGGVIAHEDDGQTGSRVAIGNAPVNLFTHLGADFAGDFFTVDNLGGHRYTGACRGSGGKTYQRVQAGDSVQSIRSLGGDSARDRQAVH